MTPSVTLAEEGSTRPSQMYRHIAGAQALQHHSGTSKHDFKISTILALTEEIFSVVSPL